MKKLLPLLLIPFLTHCGSSSGGGGGGPMKLIGGNGYGGTSVSRSPVVLNVSGWDPKEVHRSGSRYNQFDVSALRKNGGVALIARSAKGPLLDDKFGDFLKSANREGMMIGAYHYVTMDQSPRYQAESFVKRVRAIAKAKGLSGQRLLLVGDFDTKSTPDRLVSFITRIHQLTGVYPVTYLENSDALRARMNAASESQKSIIRRSPYWLALYNPKGTERTMAKVGQLTPDKLTQVYGVWNSWAMWQYGGVIWENGASRSKNFNSAAWKSPTYLGDLAMPMERNVFNGSMSELKAFWNRHSITL